MTLPEVTATGVPQEAYLLDVRETDEWRAGHAPSAAHIPLSELPRRVDEIPASGPVYVICKAGGRSAQAVTQLSQTGREAINVAGGMQSWAATGLPMISENGQPPLVI